LSDTDPACMVTDLALSLKNNVTGNVHRQKHYWRPCIATLVTQTQK